MDKIEINNDEDFMSNLATAIDEQDLDKVLDIRNETRGWLELESKSTARNALLDAVENNAHEFWGEEE